MNIKKDWKAKLESAYSFIIKYSKITVWWAHEIKPPSIEFRIYKLVQQIGIFFYDFFIKSLANWEFFLTNKKFVFFFSCTNLEKIWGERKRFDPMSSLFDESSSFLAKFLSFCLNIANSTRFGQLFAHFTVVVENT